MSSNPYFVKFRSSAKREYDAIIHGATFKSDISAWLKSLAAESVPGTPKTLSIDYAQLLEEGLELASSGTNSWKKAWKTWWEATPITKVKALLHVVRHRRPAWELRSSTRWFPQILGAFDAEVDVVYEVDHTTKQIVIVKFLGLPGADA